MCKIDVFSCETSEQRSDRVYSSDNQGSVPGDYKNRKFHDLRGRGSYARA